MPENDTETRDQAQVTITRIPCDDDLPTRVFKMARAAKQGAHLSGGALQPDYMYLRAALCVEHLRRLREPMSEAAHVVFLLAASFHVDPEDSPERLALLAMDLGDPSSVIRDAVATNRLLSKLPPQLRVVTDEGKSPPPYPPA